MAVIGLSLALAPAFAQDAPVDAAGYVIRSVSWEIKGRTKEYFLVQAAEIGPGQLFADRSALDAYVANKRQVLVNERVLESVEIEVSLGEPGAPGDPIPVDLVVRTVDTWNIIALPYFRYDSNSGLLLSLRGRDYDFLGTMQTLAINGNYTVDENSVQSLGLETSFTLPFPAFGLDWKWLLDGALSFSAGNPADIVLQTGVAADLPVGPFTVTLSANQYFYAGQKDSLGVYYDDDDYFLTNLGVDLSATLYESGSLGKLVLGPALDLDYRYTPGGLVDPSLQTTPVLTPALALSFGRYNWNGNFRSGIKASATFYMPFYLSKSTNSPYFIGSIAGYESLGWAGPSARLSGIWYLVSRDSAAGDYVRGILDTRIKTDAGLFLNLDFPIKVMDFDPATWFGVSWLRYFRFEAQISPFLDAALVHDPDTDRYFNPADGWYGAGLEAFAFPAMARSLYIRASIGFSIPDVIELKAFNGASLRDGRSVYELYFGFGHFY